MMTSIQTVVEDNRGWSERLALYNYAPDGTDPRHALPVGTLLAVKEPYLKLSLDGLPTIRVDSPGDITLLATGDPLLRGLFGELVRSWFILCPDKNHNYVL